MLHLHAAETHESQYKLNSKMMLVSVSSAQSMLNDKQVYCIKMP